VRAIDAEEAVAVGAFELSRKRLAARAAPTQPKRVLLPWVHGLEEIFESLRPPPRLHFDVHARPTLALEVAGAARDLRKKKRG
jgi:hypothetical protein